MSVTRYHTFAGYNGWANKRLYSAASLLSPEQYTADGGAFFRSVHGTLNHILVADRIWMQRLTGLGEAPARLDTIVCETFAALAMAREAEDARISAFVDGLDEAALTRVVSYTNSSGTRFEQQLDAVLDHVFNHQTHHRGQAHALLTRFLGNEASPSLDLIAYQRETAALSGAAPSPKA